MQNEPTENSIQKLLAGETERLASLVDCFRPRLKKVVQLRVGGRLSARIDPSDVIQDVYVEATRRVTKYIQSPNVGFFVWIHGVTKDVLLNSIRRHTSAKNRSIHCEVTLPNDQSAVLGRNLISHESPSRVVHRDELHAAVRNAISGLKDTDREIILMRHFDGLTNNQVAESLGLTPSTSTMRHGRALARLKSLLEKQISPSSKGQL